MSKSLLTWRSKRKTPLRLGEDHEGICLTSHVLSIDGILVEVLRCCLLSLFVFCFCVSVRGATETAHRLSALDDLLEEASFKSLVANNKKVAEAIIIDIMQKIKKGIFTAQLGRQLASSVEDPARSLQYSDALNTKITEILLCIRSCPFVLSTPSSGS